MFLAKSWKTVNGKRYPQWALKKTVWDKAEKRQRQIYIAYIGTQKTIPLEKARRICADKDITMEELRQVKRLNIEEPVKHKRNGIKITNPLPVSSMRQQAVPPDKPTSAKPAPEAEASAVDSEATPAEMVRELRAYYGLGSSDEDYDDLAYKISPNIEAEELRRVEEQGLRLDDDEAHERLIGKWRWVKGGVT